MTLSNQYIVSDVIIEQLFKTLKEKYLKDGIYYFPIELGHKIMSLTETPNLTYMEVNNERD
jgi:hypothetical protein